MVAGYGELTLLCRTLFATTAACEDQGVSVPAAELHSGEGELGLG